MWYGSGAKATLAPQGQDGDAVSPELCLIIEASLTTGAKQCTREFPQCLRHVQDFARRRRRSHDHVFGLFVTQTLHTDTFNAVKSSNDQRTLKIVPMEAALMGQSLKAAALAFTMRHLEVTQLLRGLTMCVKDTTTLRAFRQRARKHIEDRKASVLSTEKTTVMAIKAYEAIHQLARTPGAHLISDGQVLIHLEKDPFVQDYLKHARAGKLDPEFIRECLKSESLAVASPALPGKEFVLRPVSCWDYRFRSDRRVTRVRSASSGN